MLRTALAGVGLAALVLAARAGPAAPAAALRRPVTDTYHGVQVVDDYRWLEDGSDPAVRAFSDAENGYARSVLDALPGRAAIRARLIELFAAGGVSYSGVKWSGASCLALRRDPARQQPVLVAIAAIEAIADPARTAGGERTLLDPNALDPHGATAIDWYEPSPDGRLVAVSLSQGGTENGTAHVFELATGREAGAAVPGVNGGTAGGSLAWAPDSSGFYYTRYPRRGERPDAELSFYTQVYFHALASPPDNDRYELGKSFPKTAEIKLRAARKGGWMLANVQDGDSGRCAASLRSPRGSWTPLYGFDDAVVEAVFGPGPALYLLSRSGAPNGKILRLPLQEAGPAPRLADAAVIVPESAAAAVRWSFAGADTLLASATRLYTVDQSGGPEQVRVFDLDGAPRGSLPLPPVAKVDEVVPIGGDRVLYGIETYLEPKAWYVFDAAGKAAPARLAISTASPVSFADVEVVREAAIAKDGTRVPFTVLRRKGTPLDGKNPTLLAGYGGYGTSLAPGLSTVGRLWLDVGGVLATANVRGGGEYGERWHQAGTLVHKQNVVDDFIACARRLIAAGYTSPAHLAIQGYSHGGMLMGAALTQQPDLFRAVVAWSGFFDMLRLESEPNGQFNVGEFGSVKDAEQFTALHALSPYHHVRDGTVYPPVLLLIGANDPRVDPAQSRKMAARLRAAEAGRSLVLLRASAASGHGASSGMSDVVEQLVDFHAFLFQELGIRYPPPTPAPTGPGRVPARPRGAGRGPG